MDTRTDRRTEDVDRGWSYAVAIASFVSQMMIGGYVYTSGIFYTIIKNEFPEANEVLISWLCTLPITLWFIGSLIGSLLTNRFGCRICSLLGGLMAPLGMCLCFFASDIYHVFISYGIITGFGNGIQYVGFVTSVGRYFRKYRSIVTILTTLGPTVGMALFSFLIPHLNAIYRWRGCLLIIGGIMLHIWPCALALFPKNISQEKKVFDFSIFRLPKYVIFAFHCFLINIASPMTFLHLPAFMFSVNLSVVIVSTALTLFGVLNSAAKICLSFLGHVFNLSVTRVYTVCLITCGISTAMLPVMTNKPWILTIVSAIGFTFSVCGGHYLEVVAQLVGPQRFSDGVGAAQILKGCGTLVAGPLAGMIYNLSEIYDVTFYVSGSILVGSSLLLLPIIRTDSNMSELVIEAADTKLNPKEVEAMIK